MSSSNSKVRHVLRYFAYAIVFIGIIWELNPHRTLALLLWASIVALGTVRRYPLYRTVLLWVLSLKLALAVFISHLGFSLVDVLLYLVIIYDSAPHLPFIASVGLVLVSVLGIGAGRNLTEPLAVIRFAADSMVIVYVTVASYEEAKRKVPASQELNDWVIKAKKLEAAYEELVQNQLSLQGAAVLEERARMAREVHDSVSGSLTAIIVTAEAMEKRLAHGVEDIRPELSIIKEQARIGLKDTRHSLSNLRPTALTQDSFLSVVRALVEQIQRWYGIDVDLSVSGLEHTIPPEQVSVLSRLIQEATTNAIRHGKSTALSVSITDNAGGLKIVVRDNGTGCARVKLGYGLTGMTERIQAVGGDVVFTSEPGRGFEVLATLPRGGMK